MKSYNIRIEAEDATYAKALARAGAVHCPGWIFDLFRGGGENGVDGVDGVDAGSPGQRFTVMEEGDYLKAGEKKIYKYQKAGKVFSAMADAFGLGMEYKESAIKHGCLRFAVMGIDGGSGVSTFVITLARILSIYHEKKVLVINKSLFGYGMSESGGKNCSSRILFEEYEAMKHEATKQEATKYEAMKQEATKQETIEGKGRREKEIPAGKAAVIPAGRDTDTPVFYRDEYGVFYLGSEKGINGASFENSSDSGTVINRLIAKLNPELTIWDFGNVIERAGLGKAKWDKVICLHRGSFNEKRAAALGELAGENFVGLHVVNMAGNIMPFDIWEGIPVAYLDYDNKPDDLDGRYGLGVSVIADSMP